MLNKYKQMTKKKKPKDKWCNPKSKGGSSVTLCT